MCVFEKFDDLQQITGMNFLFKENDHSFNSRPQKEEVRQPEEILNEKRTRGQSGQQNQTNVHWSPRRHLALLSQTEAARKGSDKRKSSTGLWQLKQRDAHRSSQTKTRPSRWSSVSKRVTSLTTGRLHRRRKKNISGIENPAGEWNATIGVAEFETEVANRTKYRSRNSLKLLSWSSLFLYSRRWNGRHLLTFIWNSRTNLYKSFVTTSMASWKPLGGRSKTFLSGLFNFYIN